MDTKKSFILYLDYRQHLELLSDVERGQLLFALFDYAECGAKPQLGGMAQMAFSFISSQIDRDTERWAEIKNARAEAGRKGGIASGSKRKQSEANIAIASELKQREASEAVTVNVTDTDNDTVNKNVTEKSIDATAPTPAKSGKHKYGTYGWVRLTDREYSRLLQELGETELTRCITYIDESAQSNGNKNKWKDWNLVIRKCSRERWGLNKTYKEANLHGNGANRQHTRSGDTFKLTGFTMAGEHD